MKGKLLALGLVALVLSVGAMLGAGSAEEVFAEPAESCNDTELEAECHYTCSWCTTSDKACDVYGNCC